jgi:hypothetical protein
MPLPDARGAIESPWCLYGVWAEAAGDHEGQVAYDLMPFDEEAGYCHGPSCKRHHGF